MKARCNAGTSCQNALSEPTEQCTGRFALLALSMNLLLWCMKSKQTCFSCTWSQVDDAAVQQLAQGCRQLQTLGLYCCGSLTDDAMHALAQHLPRLQHLNVSGCRKLTAPALQAVVDSNRQLHTCR